MHRLAAALLILALAACADRSWQREGVADDRLRQDLAACQAEARVAVRRDLDIDSDIMASRGQDWQTGGVLGIKRDVMRTQAEGRAEDIVARCMRAKGYSPAT